ETAMTRCFYARRRIIAVGVMLALVCCAVNTPAQETSGKFQLPADPTQWVNSGPVSLDLLKGKAAVLWFYEESCPTCREKWPPLLAMAKKYEGQPVMFIGVNSGNPRPVVEQYARGVGCNWPIIVDAT